MGVYGLWQELESIQQRVSLDALATDKRWRQGLNESRGLRMAIDVAIWSFHAKTGKGGTKPELRLFFFRLCRLLLLGVLPVFVFDGPHRPTRKRDKTVKMTVHPDLFAMKSLIRLFGFNIWEAHGEAEAECARLQQLGYVDVVLTDDVDVLLFGATRVIRNWIGETTTNKDGLRTPKKVTRVDSEENTNVYVRVYDMKDIEEELGLDRDALIFVGLLSGSDYDTKGVPGVGMQHALTLARIGFGSRMINEMTSHSLNKEDFRQGIEAELRTNASGMLQRRSNVSLPTTFPSETITLAYANPKCAIDDRSTSEPFDFEKSPDLRQIARFCQSQFNWSLGTVIIRFVNCLYPGFCVHYLLKSSRQGVPVSTSKDAPKSTMTKPISNFFKATKATTDLKSSIPIPARSRPSHSMKATSKPRKNSLAAVDFTPGLVDIHSHRTKFMIDEYRVEWTLDSVEGFIDAIVTALEGDLDSFRKDKDRVLDCDYADETVTILGDAFSPPAKDLQNDDTINLRDAHPFEKHIKKVSRQWVHTELIATAYPEHVKRYERFSKARPKQPLSRNNSMNNPTTPSTSRQQTLFDYGVALTPKAAEKHIDRPPAPQESPMKIDAGAKPAPRTPKTNHTLHFTDPIKELSPNCPKEFDEIDAFFQRSPTHKPRISSSHPPKAKTLVYRRDPHQSFLDTLKAIQAEMAPQVEPSQIVLSSDSDTSPVKPVSKTRRPTSYLGRRATSVIDLT